MTRSQMMARIGSKNTVPELTLRRGLHANGLRFRLHRRDLPGKPDLVLPKFKAAIFVHGCFWHAHSDCRFYRLPRTRADFWADKLARNRDRDVEAVEKLAALGWRTLTVWECTTRAVQPEIIANLVEEWLRSGAQRGEISEKSVLSR